ncbi:MAG: NAD-dependent epimerase/dehydratase family protein [Candidatus Schekmanbacteria bacterium]|nr:MAG: NAD-dependent epimerase/dehydratase family protein [Candidatus Schekmanbacteria bacterium]
MEQKTNKMRKTFFITGATGLLGSRVAYELVNNGYNVICLARSREDEKAEERVIKKISFWSPSECRKFFNNITILDGDIEAEDLGLKKDAISLLKDVSPIFIHSAACTSFEARDKKSLFKTNLEGTKNCLNTAKAVSALHFNHISTAYIAGNYNGIFSESDFNVNQQFKNAYEESKFEAEKAVRKFSEATKIPVTIFRPSIIMGDTLSGKTFNFNTLYSYLKVINVIASRIRNKKISDEIRFECSKNTTKNIIPADYASKAIAALILSKRQNRLETFHITNPNPPTFSKLNKLFHKALSLKPLKLVDLLEENKDKLSKTETMLKKAMKTYRSYLFHEPLLASMYTLSILEERGIAFPNLDEDYYFKIIDYFLKKNSFSKKEKNAFIQLFEIRMQSAVGTRIIPNLKTLTKDFVLCLEDINTNYFISVEEGKLISFQINSPKEGLFKFTLSSNVFTDLLLSKIRPQEAFFKKLVHIDGSLLDALSLSTVFEKFFSIFSSELNELQMA